MDFIYDAYEIGTGKHDTYIGDGAVIQKGDAYMNIRLHYDLGAECHDFRFYFRNGYPCVTNLEQYAVR